MSVGHYENFPVGSLLLPRRMRRAVHAIYRFARYADDVADEGDAAPAERLAELDRIEADLDRIAAGEPTRIALMASLAAAVAEHALPLQPMRDLLSAFRQDVVKTRYQSFGELVDYCRRSANPVGRLMLALYGETDPRSLAQADGICTALQLINFWQDVALDWRKGRVYLPQEDLARFGVDEAQIAAGRFDAKWRALMLFQVERARKMLQAGAPLGKTLRGRLGLELRLIVMGGERILSKLHAADGDVFTRRPVLGGRDWIYMMWRACRAK
ncbi:squalene synthase HpnC [Chromobacterium violaceum]|uniref:squalene synthase HpnC n=1 Tax=Chromobacterium violaceum TaxID=536 RepID=UPI0009D9412A|nr:squalene synthase HpnC [Chromobacterium violaceum]OQS09343.1 squalene synthase HpnC [Chromobacterium violaceum]OQS24790.1 squalene synthase HpnC [Chromobacterium violaceum]